ncbi:DNA recombination protein RmuC [Campylobacter sp. FMV-PI01]|uniref:DNA recombination protein RmuC n=1 Tax=Campylobacter portucalensis TaxID=2608384 RepID=A0A6L5WHC0_9BACT|nr:DNA recombination protein RmuC [Campylobacter portucalensis]MSN96276.1 DNA recombination protein RmuC [Campylobacter portucalensis]
MEVFYTLFIFLIILIFILIFLNFRQKEFFATQISNMQNLLNEQSLKHQTASDDLNDSIVDRFFSLNQSLNQSFTNSELRTSNNLDNSVKSIDTKFKDILQKINELENSNNSTMLLKDEIAKLNKIFNNVKLRGNIGEFELKKILELTYGRNNNFYEIQKKLDNGLIVDVALKIKENLYLGIDSKFPLTSYQNICDALENNDSKALTQANKDLIKNMKKHIDDISNKYILPPSTTEFAVLFLPSEAIFTYICSNLDEIFHYMIQKGVFICSPSTIMSLLYTLRIFIKDENTNKNINSIKSQIYNLSKEFELFEKYNNEILKHSNKLVDFLKVLNENSKKISQNFKEIMG